MCIVWDVRLGRKNNDCRSLSVNTGFCPEYPSPAGHICKTAHTPPKAVENVQTGICASGGEDDHLRARGPRQITDQHPTPTPTVDQIT